jgi:hypothetical protein
MAIPGSDMVNPENLFAFDFTDVVGNPFAAQLVLADRQQLGGSQPLVYLPSYTLGCITRIVFEQRMRFPKRAGFFDNDSFYGNPCLAPRLRALRSGFSPLKRLVGEIVDTTYNYKTRIYPQRLIDVPQMLIDSWSCEESCEAK